MVVVDVVDVVVVDVVVDVVVLVDGFVVVGTVVTSVFDAPAQPDKVATITMREISLALIPSP